jgi:hypothetical protein
MTDDGSKDIIMESSHDNKVEVLIQLRPNPEINLVVHAF